MKVYFRVVLKELLRRPGFAGGERLSSTIYILLVIVFRPKSMGHESPGTDHWDDCAALMWLFWCEPQEIA